MNTQNKIKINRAIIEIKNPYPEDDMILCYSDFLKVRDYLRYYQFNPIVFDNLVRLTNDIWKTKQRINRLTLLRKIKQYKNLVLYNYLGSHFNMPVFEFSMETRKLLFELFKKTFEDSSFISEKQLEEARMIANSLLINVILSPIEEEWLCVNAPTSELILNRVLRYPIKSGIISSWIKDNFLNNEFRNRRAELISWIIDENPTFEIDQQILIEDFLFMNNCDLQAIKNYENEVFANNIIRQELNEYLPNITYRLGGSNYEEKAYIPEPKLKLFKRSYKVPFDRSKRYPTDIPDFTMLVQDFCDNFSFHKKLVMIWAIGYSRIDNSLKCSLLKKYYTERTYPSIYKVCLRNQNVELLNWLLEN